MRQTFPKHFCCLHFFNLSDENKNWVNKFCTFLFNKDKFLVWLRRHSSAGSPLTEGTPSNCCHTLTQLCHCDHWKVRKRNVRAVYLKRKKTLFIIRSFTKAEKMEEVSHLNPTKKTTKKTRLMRQISNNNPSTNHWPPIRCELADANKNLWAIKFETFKQECVQLLFESLSERDREGGVWHFPLTGTRHSGSLRACCDKHLFRVLRREKYPEFLKLLS